MRRFAIGDIHGWSYKFKSLVDSMKPSPGDEIYLLGDICDKGPDTKGTIDFALQLQKDGIVIRLTLGNHEAMLLSLVYGYLDVVDDSFPRNISKSNGRRLPESIFIEASVPYITKSKNGLRSTLTSYGITSESDDWDEIITKASEFSLPNDHLAFLQSGQLFFQIPGWFLSHAGLSPNALAQESLEKAIQCACDSPSDFLWTTGIANSDCHFSGEVAIAHGHTPVQRLAKHLPSDCPEAVISSWQNGIPCMYKNKLCLDSHASRTEGKLSAAELFEDRSYNIYSSK